MGDAVISGFGVVTIQVLFGLTPTRMRFWHGKARKNFALGKPGLRRVQRLSSKKMPVSSLLGAPYPWNIMESDKSPRIVRDHGAFLNSYAPQDEGLYDDAATR